MAIGAPVASAASANSRSRCALDDRGARGRERVVVELEDHVVADGRLDDCVKVDRELVLVAGVADHVDVRVGHHAQQRVGVLGAVALVEARERVEAHRDEVELVEHDVGQVDAVLLGQARDSPRSP